MDSGSAAVSARGGAAANGSASGSIPGRAVKNSFAMRAKTPGSRTPAGMLDFWPGSTVSNAPVAERATSFRESLVVMIVPDFDVLQRSNCVVHKNRRGAVQRY